MGRTQLLITMRRELVRAPLKQPARIFIPFMTIDALQQACLTCALNVNFLSRKTPSHRRESLTFVASSWLPSMIRELDVGVICCPLAPNVDESRFAHVYFYSISIPFLWHHSWIAPNSRWRGETFLGCTARDLDDSIIRVYGHKQHVHD
jgi:hypothetical protein